MDFSLTGLFISAFIASTLFPGGSELILLYLYNDRPEQYFTLLAVATLGNSLGGISSWALGRLLIWRFPLREWQTRHRDAMNRLSRLGSPVLLFSWLPIVGDPLCVAAGWLKIHWLKALLFISLGKLLRYWFVLELARRAM
ncbi:MAG: DedA family protein [Gammaproteobacteria bacterium]|nr:DedA family protein [Gammaproteobacteria bacterium]